MKDARICSMFSEIDSSVVSLCMIIVGSLCVKNTRRNDTGVRERWLLKFFSVNKN
jgi:hypothetical protein